MASIESLKTLINEHTGTPSIEVIPNITDINISLYEAIVNSAIKSVISY